MVPIYRIRGTRRKREIKGDICLCMYTQINKLTFEQMEVTVALLKHDFYQAPSLECFFFIFPHLQENAAFDTKCNIRKSLLSLILI